MTQYDWIWFWLFMSLLTSPIHMINQCAEEDLDCHWNEIIFNCIDKELPQEWKLNESIIHTKKMEQLEENLPDCSVKMIDYLYEMIFTNVDNRKDHCCYLWDFFQCISIESCQQCGKKTGDIMSNAYRDFQQNVTTELCSDYPERSLKCHLLSLPLIGIIFIISSLAFAAGFMIVIRFYSS